MNHLERQKDSASSAADRARTLLSVLEDLQAERKRLAEEIEQRRHAEEALRRLNEELDRRVQERTAELSQANERLAQQSDELQRSVEQLAASRSATINMMEDIDKARARAEQAETELTARNQDLETLLYVASHDLREPLRAIQNFSRMVVDRYSDELPEKGQDFLRRVTLSADRLDGLIDDVLVLSRAQRMEQPTTTIEGQAVVSDVLSTLDNKITTTGASVQVADNLPRLLADQRWATQAVYNLVANALKFTKDGEAPDLEIVAYCPDDVDSKEVGIVVQDRGIGIAQEHAERIFTLFQRAVGRDIDGHGAGLAIVRQIAERHGGRAWAGPRDGGGSEFFVTFGAAPDM